jgi:DNA modification methylase
MPKKKPEKSISKIHYGDQFLLGEHKLLCADATDTATINKFIGDTVITQINSDCPYGILYTQSKAAFGNIRVNKEILNDDITSEKQYAKFTKAWLMPIIPHLAKKNSVYIFNSDKMIFALREGMEQAGVRFSQLLVWIKNQAVIGRKDFLPMHELIAYGWFGTHQFIRGKSKSVLYYPKPSRSQYHPTSKPIGLIRHLILNNTKIGDTVYDCFLGGGTALLACEQTKRKCLGVELDPDYCCTAIQRWEKLTSRQAVKLPSIKEVKIYG